MATDDLGTFVARAAGNAVQDAASNAVADVTQVISATLQDVAAGAAATASGVLAEELYVFSRALGSLVQNDKERMRATNDIIARKAQASVVKSFREKHKSRSSGPARPDRYANGAMVRALGDPSFYEARWDGISFGITGHLDRTAKQWYRLNFGAGDAGFNTPGGNTYSIRFFGQVAGTLSLGQQRPSSAFGMPPGAFFTRSGNLANSTGEGDASRRGSDYFMPAGAINLGPLGIPFRGTKVTKGIVGTNYLDAGIRELAKSMGEGWSALALQWYREAATTDTGPISKFYDPEQSQRAFRRLSRGRSNLLNIAARFELQLLKAGIL